MDSRPNIMNNSAGVNHGGVFILMFGSNWLCRVAIVGWLAFAGASHAQDQHNPKQAVQNPLVSNRVGAAPTPMSSPQAKIEDPSSLSCKGTDKPELSCNAISAQAALDQARDARWQIVIGCVQAVGLVASLFFSARAASAAFGAVREAEKGAQASRDAVVEAKRSANAAHEANRPWLKMTVAEKSHFTPKESFGRDSFQVSVEVENLGSGPAIQSSLRCYMIDAAKGLSSESEIKRAYNHARNRPGFPLPPIFKGEKKMFSEQAYHLGGILQPVEPQVLIPVGQRMILIIIVLYQMNGRSEPFYTAGLFETKISSEDFLAPNTTLTEITQMSEAT